MTETGSRAPSGDEPVRDLTPFAAVDAWIFDLDNTLYPRHTNLFAQVDTRIRDYVQRLLKVDAEEAHRIQKDYYRRYGTTLRGLMEERGIQPDDFLAYVHDIDHSPVEPDPVLASAIARAAGAEVHLHQRLAGPRRKGGRAPRLHRPLRGHLRYRPLGAPAQAGARDL